MGFIWLGVIAIGVLGWTAGWISKFYFDGGCSEDHLSSSQYFLSPMGSSYVPPDLEQGGQPEMDWA